MGEGSSNGLPGRSFEFSQFFPWEDFNWFTHQGLQQTMRATNAHEDAITLVEVGGKGP